MIIQCEQCRTKFRLDDSKVSERGIKVRCAKCRHIFTVRKDASTQESPASAEAITPPSAAAFSPAEALQQVEAPAAPLVSGIAGHAELHSEAPEETFSFTGETVVEPSAVPEAAVTETGFSFDDAVPAAEQPDTEPIRFDFGDPSPAAAPAGVEEFSVTWTDKEETFSFSETTAPTAASDDVPDFSGIDLGTEQPVTTESAATDDQAEPAPFATAAPPANTEEQDMETQESPAAMEQPAETVEAPPLSISSRRRQGSFASILIAVITILVVGVLGYMAYLFINGGPQALSLFGKQGTTVEEGKITVQNLSSYFIPAAAPGELLVITGTAQNSYAKPRAALQLKAVLFGQSNQILVTKTAFAGNQLTKEQLVAMPAEKIEAVMNNQFGDSLVNLEVPPGKGIPFTIVIINPPADAKDYGVEAVGSTVATANK